MFYFTTQLHYLLFRKLILNNFNKFLCLLLLVGFTARGTAGGFTKERTIEAQKHENYTIRNIKKAQSIVNNSIDFHGGQSAINAIDSVVIDYDSNTTFQTQGYGYRGIESIRQQPGNTLHYISFKEKELWVDSVYHYMESYFSTKTHYKDGNKINYDDGNETKSVAKAVDFDNEVESMLLFNPLLLLKSVMAQKNTLRYLGTVQFEDIEHEIVNFTLASGTTLTVYINKTTYQFGKVESITLRKNNIALDEFTYGDYASIDGFQLPNFIENKYSGGGYPGSQYYRIASIKFNAKKHKVIKLPINYKEKAKSTTYDGNTRTQQLFDGGYWVTRNGGNTIFVEFSDHIMVVGGLDRVEKRIKEVRKLIPTKPIKFLVTSHQHHDHIGSTPYFAKLGATIVTAQEYKALIEDLIDNENNDKNAKPKFDVVADKTTYSDGKQTVEVYKLHNLKHAKTMLLTYFPKEKLVYMPDHYYEPLLHYVAIKALLDEIERIGIKPKGFISGHGNQVISIATLQQLIKKTPKVNSLKRAPHSSVILK